MSFHVVGWVLKHSEARLADRLVLLALAEYAHDDGSKAFPKLKTIMRKAKVEESTARGCLRKLERKGAIEHTGQTRGGVRIYKVLLTDAAANLEGPPAGGPDSEGPKSEGGPADPGGRGPDPGPSNRGGSPGTDPKSPSGSTGVAKADAPLSYLLAELLEANGVPEHKRKVTKRWADAERLMKDRDGRDPAQMEQLLRWATANEFWRANVLSMTGFREKYDQIRLQAERDGRPASGAGGARAGADADVQRLEQMQREAEEREGESS